MDTILILLSLATLILFMKKPQSNAGLAIFWIVWLGTALLFNYHVTSKLALNF
jgi:hypothetical protein